MDLEDAIVTVKISDGALSLSGLVSFFGGCIRGQAFHGDLIGGPHRGKSDGVIGNISERETGIG